MENNFRSSCPLVSALDVIGDKWSLIIVRDMLLGGKKTFKEFSASQEGIATNLLSSRLKMLECFDLISKRKLPKNKKENIYLLTEKGLDLTPIITDIILWSDKHVRQFNTKMLQISDKGFDADRSIVIENIKNNYREIVRQTIG
ncbi:MAG: transcriptional regulator [Flexibacter sp. CG_4_10_14_3_um_filter_32_15]|nr:MAG: transcriptional regulator [Flexibacter sp. CG_4_10_14_3_um_filter_32_15]